MGETRFFPDNWGFMPVLFRIGTMAVPAYSFFMLLAIIVGVTIYCIEARRCKNFSEKAFYIVIAALAGGALGSKIPVWIMNYQMILQRLPDITPLLSGRTILGGMIGGSLAVALVKRRFQIQLRIGNQIAPAAAIGMAIGRIGCFFRGCCYGIPTHHTWGVNFGDGLLRHPTQVYDGLFNLALFIYFIFIRNKVNMDKAQPGKLFRIYLTYYFLFRIMIEFIRDEPRGLLGLTTSQLVSILALLYMRKDLFVKLFKRKEVPG